MRADRAIWRSGRRLGLLVAGFLAFACGGGDENRPGLLTGPNATAEPTVASAPARQPTPENVDRAAWHGAMLDTSSSLPGQYVPPHPGADGVICDSRACIGRHDDLNHYNQPIPLCSPVQLAAKNYSSPLCYQSNPPTSGPHGPTFAQNRVYEEPLPREMLVHTMEHASVVIWYNTADQQVIRTLAAITNGANQARKLVTMVPYTDMEPNTIALTAWTRLDKFPASQLRDQRVVDFINAHSRRYNPEGF